LVAWGGMFRNRFDPISESLASLATMRQKSAACPRTCPQHVLSRTRGGSLPAAIHKTKTLHKGAFVVLVVVYSRTPNRLSSTMPRRPHRSPHRRAEQGHWYGPLMHAGSPARL
jgi:hypothetical protein